MGDGHNVANSSVDPMNSDDVDVLDALVIRSGKVGWTYTTVIGSNW